MINIILIMLFSRYIRSLQSAQSSLVCVGDVEEPVLVFAALVHMSHQRVSLQEVASVHKEVERVLLRQLYALPDDVVEVIRRQVVRNEVPRQGFGPKRTYLVLSMLGSLEVADFSQMTGILSGYFSLILSASAFLVSVG